MSRDPDPLAEDVDAVLASLAGLDVERLSDTKEGWLGSVLDQARGLASIHLAGDEEELEYALDGIERLRTVEADLARLGARGLRSVLAVIYSGEDRKAREAWHYWIEDGATYEERRAAQQAASVEAQRVRLARELGWERIRSALRSIGAQTLRVLVPVLLAGL